MALEIFKIVGEVAAKGVKETQRDLEDVGDTAENSSSKLGSFFSKMGSMAATAGKAMAAGLAVGTTALGFLSKSSIQAYGDYEQLVGGIETLFGTGGKSIEEYAKSVNKSVADVKSEYANLEKAQKDALKNADNAWKNQGISANQYMETITSFSASLIASLNGDTVKATQVADMAISDMSDNANKMGTDMAMIQETYQGFAKQNFMMLDNLKLGYGGTKGEMERLLKDAEKIKRANGEMASYSIDSFADMVEAIHVVQEDMGITGTTALEAEKTIQGSANAMKAAWQNLMVGMADDGQNFDKLIGNFTKSVGTFASNVAPRLKLIFKAIPTALKEIAPSLAGIAKDLLPSLIQGAAELVAGLISALPDLVGSIISGIRGIFPTLIQSISDLIKQLGTSMTSGVQSFIPQFVKQASEMMKRFGNELKENLPIVIDKALDMLIGFSETILENIPTLVESGMDMLKGLVQGIVGALPDLIAKAPEIINNFANTINNSFPIILKKGAEIVMEIIKGIIGAIPTLVANIPKIFEAIWNTWQAINWVKLGKFLIENIGKGIKAVFNGFKDWVKGIFDNVGVTIKDVFVGIKNTTTNVWNAIKTAITSPIEGAKNLVSSIISAIKTNITNVFNGIKTTATNVWNSIKTAITSPIETAKNIVKNIIDTIKGFFNFKITWPKIPLPHFAIKPKGWDIGDLLKGDIPSLSIDWYAKGGILEKPTAFGINPANGNVMVGGEAGKEAVAPISELMDYVRVAVAESNGGMYDILERILTLLAELLPQFVGMQLVLDTGVLAGEIAPAVDERLGVIKSRKGRQ